MVAARLVRRPEGKPFRSGKRLDGEVVQPIAGFSPSCIALLRQRDPQRSHDFVLLRLAESVIER